MRTSTAAAMLLCLLLAANAAAPALAQNMPADCQQAMVTRSPQGQIDLFTSCLDSGAITGDDRATALKQRAIAYMHLGRHQFAIDDLNEAIKTRSGDADNYYLRGFAYRALGQYQRALDDSNRAISMDPNFAAAYANRAFVNLALGNRGQARNDAERARAIDPTVKVPNI